MINKEKEKARNLRKYKKKREINRSRGCKLVIGTLESRLLKKKGLKFCPKCKKTKVFKDFNKSNLKYSTYCTLCFRRLAKMYDSPKKRKEKYQRNKESVISNRLQTKFGMTLDQYNLKLSKQRGKCNICGITEEQNKKRLAVDHNHQTGEIRDLLCNNCNVLIGFLKEDLKVSLNLTKYIRRWRK